jgi:hypothetical protein
VNDGDPILAAKTISEFMAAVDAVYHWDYPVTVPAGTDLALMWAAPIEVTKDPRPGVYYLATGTSTLPITVPPATVIAEIVTVPPPEEEPR